MKRLTILMICILMMTVAAGCSHSNKEVSTGQVFFGDWIIDSKLPDAPMGDFEEEDLKTILGAGLSFSAEKASCFGDALDTLGQTVDKPEYVTMDVSRSDFESMTGESFDSIGRQGDNITQVSVVKDPERNTGIVFYIIDDNTLLANSAGTFFLVKKIK